MSQPRTKQKNVVFDPTDGRVTTLNFQHNPKGEFTLYGDAYHRAAKHLLEGILARELPYVLDACPVVFLYRHALELHMKHVILWGNKLLKLEGKAAASGDEIFKEHRLTALLVPVERILDCLRWKDTGFQYGCIQDFGDCKTVIENFDAIDGRSDAFRYPVDTKGNGIVGEYFAFDVQRVAALLDSVIELFSTVAYALDYECHCVHEARAAREQEELEAFLRD